MVVCPAALPPSKLFFTSEQKGGVTLLFVPFLTQGGHTPSIRSYLISTTSRSEIDPTAQATYSRLRSLRKLRKLRRPRTVTDALSQATAGGHLANYKTVVWRILNMFDPAVSSLLQGESVDGPANATMLCPGLHNGFGLLHWYLEDVPGGGGRDGNEVVHVFYRTRGAPLLPLYYMPAGPGGTVRFTRMDGSRTELPSRRLLAVHRVYAKVLGVAGAAQNVEDLLEELEDVRCTTGLAAMEAPMLVRVGVGLGSGWFCGGREGIAV